MREKAEFLKNYEKETYLTERKSKISVPKQCSYSICSVDLPLQKEITAAASGEAMEKVRTLNDKGTKVV